LIDQRRPKLLLVDPSTNGLSDGLVLSIVGNPRELRRHVAVQILNPDIAFSSASNAAA
jgi:hypothetical protein